MTPTRTIRLKRQKVCARCGPLRAGRKMDRHHPALLSTFFPYVPGMRSQHKKFDPADVCDICAVCHLEFHEFVATPLLWECWYSYPKRHRDTQMALEASSAVSAVFWDWLEDRSYARETSQLRWSPDPEKRDSLTILHGPTSSLRSSHST